MGNKYLVIIAVALLLTGAAIAAPAGDNAKEKDNGKEKVRVIAHTDKEISDAKSKGCKVVQNAKTLKALECSKDAASSLGLQEDVRVFAMDALANTQIGANLVHASGNTGTGRKVVVLDTGYNYNHVELSSSYLGGWDFVNGDSDPMDDNGHGSHVAGIITADGVNTLAKGVAPDTGIIAGKVLSASGGGYFSDVVAATYWAVDTFNPDAISMSLGTSPPWTYSGFCDNALPDLTTAIKYAVDRGVIVVVAAGNSGSSGVSIPGCISYSTTAGAVDSGDNIASFSGRGLAVDIVAPGVSIFSSTFGSNSYAYASGTSMATPVVSGTVALIKSSYPGYTVAQVQDALFNNARDLGATGKDSTYGWGRVDAYKASAIVHDVAVTSISAPGSATQGTLVNVNVNVANQGNQPESFTVTLTDGTVTLNSSSVSLGAGSSASLSFSWDTSTSSSGDHAIKAEASVVTGETDASDNVKTTTVTILVPDNTPPAISNVQVSGVTATGATITWTTNEPGNSLVRYGTAAPPSSTASASSLVTGHSITLSGLSASATYYFEVQSTDASGNTAVENNSRAYYSFTTPAPKTMYVSSIGMSTARTGNKIYAIATVTIVDSAGNRVQGATAYGHWSGLANNIVSGTTGVDGRVALTSNSVKSNKHGTFTFTVDNVVLSGWVYAPAKNIETGDSIRI